MSTAVISLVDENTVPAAAAVHSAAWQDSHRAFCTPDFTAAHTPERQAGYIRRKMAEGSRFYLLSDPEPAGIVSVRDHLIEDLYVLPEKQGRGLGTRLMAFALKICGGEATLWILENNTRAEKLYLRLGFERTGARHEIRHGLDEIEMSLAPGGTRPKVI